jgi:membrane fusion protein, heavy metal efflux system
MKKYFYLLLIATVVSSCKQKEDSKENHDFTVQGDTISVSKESSLTGKLKTSIAVPETYYPHFSTSGVVKAIPTKYAEIASPFAGRITKSLIRLGQKVIAGSPIFEISSPEFFETTKEFYQAKQEMGLAYKNLRRENDLLQNKVGVKKEKEEAELDYELKKKDFENAKAALQVYRINTNHLVFGHPLVVRSPISGEVVKSNIVLGQYLKEDAAPVAIIANLNTVWVVAHVKEKDVNLIRNLSNVDISLVALPGKDIKGRIYHISEMMDEDTRSVEVLIECKNTKRLMKPGMYATVKLTDAPISKILIPSSAVLQDEDDNYVLVSIGNNKYVKRKVTTASATGGRLVVLSGLNPREQIVTEGTFYLNEAR